MTVLVDSDILIEVSRGRNADIVSRWVNLSNSDVAVLYSPVSVAELWAGARPNEFDALNNLFGALICTPTRRRVARRAIRSASHISSNSGRRGRRVACSGRSRSRIRR